MGHLYLQEVVFFDILRIMKMKTTAILCASVLLWAANGYSQYLTVRGSVPLTPREGITVVGTNAFAVGANALTIISFSNPQSPEVIGQNAPGVGTLSAVAVRGNYAYCAGQGSGIVVIDISNLQSPTWVRNVQASSPIGHVAIGDTFLAAATGLNVSFYGLSNPSQPHLLTTFGRAANRVAIDAAARKIHCAGVTGAFVLSWTVSQGNVTLSAADEFGSNEYTSVSLGGTYVNFAQGLQFSALNKSTYSLAGQYGAAGQIRAVASGSDYSVIGLAAGGVEYLRQPTATPEFVSSVQAQGGINDLAISGNDQYILAATSSGVTVITNAPLTSDPIPLVPTEFSLSAYPNPFNSSTTISWTGRLHQTGTLRVYDIEGREVMSRTVGQDQHSGLLDFSNFAAGSYLVRIESAKFSFSPLRVVYLP